MSGLSFSLSTVSLAVSGISQLGILCPSAPMMASGAFPASIMMWEFLRLRLREDLISLPTTLTTSLCLWILSLVMRGWVHDPSMCVPESGALHMGQWSLVEYLSLKAIFWL